MHRHRVIIGQRLEQGFAAIGHRLNPHRGDVYEAAQKSLTELVEAVQSNDRERFREILADARKFLVTER